MNYRRYIDLVVHNFKDELSIRASATTHFVSSLTPGSSLQAQEHASIHVDQLAECEQHQVPKNTVQIRY